MTADSATVRQRGVLMAALLLTGLSMRTAVSSIGAVLADLQRGLHASGGSAGLITTLPVLCFAGFGVVTPHLSRRIGPHRLLTVALVMTTVGLAARPLSGDARMFALLSVPALAGSAASNVLMPSLVKLHFPDRIGTMTALYTTALAVGATAAAGLSVPIGSVAGGWRAGIGVWAVLAGLAVLPWLSTLTSDRTPAISSPPTRSGRPADAPPPSVPPRSALPRSVPTQSVPTRSVSTRSVSTRSVPTQSVPTQSVPTRGVPLRTLLRSRTAWALAIFFGTQSMQAYIAFGWFARFLTDHGISAGTAGVMLALLSALGIPVSLIAPRVSANRHRLLVAGFSSCFLAAYVLMAVAPRQTAWVWMILAGIGGGTFPLVLTLLGLRGRTPETIATLSAFVQAIGYLIAGTGPLLFGALFGLTNSWALPMVVLFGALTVMVAAAIPATAPRYVDDELETIKR